MPDFAAVPWDGWEVGYFAALTFAAIGATSTPLAYLLGSPWWRTWLGRAIASATVAVALAIDATWLLEVLYHAGVDLPLPAAYVLSDLLLVAIGSAKFAFTVVVRRAQRGDLLYDDSLEAE